MGYPSTFAEALFVGGPEHGRIHAVPNHINDYRVAVPHIILDEASSIVHAETMPKVVVYRRARFAITGVLGVPVGMARSFWRFVYDQTPGSTLDDLAEDALTRAGRLPKDVLSEWFTGSSIFMPASSAPITSAPIMFGELQCSCEMCRRVPHPKDPEWMSELTNAALEKAGAWPEPGLSS